MDAFLAVPWGVTSRVLQVSHDPFATAFPFLSIHRFLSLSSPLILPTTKLHDEHLQEL